MHYMHASVLGQNNDHSWLQPYENYPETVSSTRSKISHACHCL